VTDAATPTTAVPPTLRDRIATVGQEHLLNFVDELTPEQLGAFVAQLETIDFERVPRLVEEYVNAKPTFDAAQHDITPPTAFAFDDPSWNRDRFYDRGAELISDGKVAAFTVAGGQGSRLGYDGPKGCFPGGAVTGKPLFAMLAEWVLWARKRFETDIPWYVMTSPLNHQTTIDFFDEHAHFGLPREDVVFFQQGAMPSFDMRTGRILLKSKGEIATNPDGHGGSLRALHTSGALADMRSRGVEHISYVQVDNPLARVIDPVFVGLHAGAEGSSAEMSTKVIAKIDPAEKVGVIADVDGKTGVIEYSDLPDDLAAKRSDNGDLFLKAGNTAIHMISVDFVERLNQGGSLGLPFHRAEKKVPCIDPDSGTPINPAEPNGVKLEMFVFDALPLTTGSIVYEVERVDDFAPIKNAEGTDSPASSKALQTERAARWLEARGVAVPRTADGSPDCTLEISPLTATCSEDLPGDAMPREITPGQSLAL
jgi:UDP-N-acetylglucosamine/UDP-N-acetylgalactosamine diphosphorylase